MPLLNDFILTVVALSAYFLDSSGYLFLSESIRLRSFCFRVWEESSGVILEEAFICQNAGW